jgi:cell wall-associated NlpC family hydrolase
LHVSLDLGMGATTDLSPSAGTLNEMSLSSGFPAMRAPGEAGKPYEASGLIEHALSFMGVKYRRGGSKPESGLDCSGLVGLVFRDVSGLELPRRAEEISRLGQRVSRGELQPGDLIFFNTVRRTISHVGIYLGDGQFIHAPASGGRVRIESIELPYWIKHFSAARRIGEPPPDSRSN